MHRRDIGLGECEEPRAGVDPRQHAVAIVSLSLIEGRDALDFGAHQ